MKHLVTLAFLLVAAGFYVAGMTTGVVAFAGAGVLAEGAFWFRLKAQMGK
ncbi:MAG: hypothetical protein KGJ50_03610 [Xanthomonadaceae bacterium]|nr:hypothetical protein [Xanthomonadaceae bacterium]